MSDMNNVSLIGRLTADPELKTTQNGISYCRFTVAVNRYSKDGELCCVEKYSGVYLQLLFKGKQNRPHRLDTDRLIHR